MYYESVVERAVLRSAVKAIVYWKHEIVFFRHFALSETSIACVKNSPVGEIKKSQIVNFERLYQLNLSIYGLQQTEA